MLTPVELQNLPLKAGIGGYKKKDVDTLLGEICKDYETLYKENLELKDKLSVLSEGLQYYKEMEKTLQKTLVVAEKAAEEVEATSKAKAELMKEKALAEAAYIIEDAKKQAQQIHNQTLMLVQQYENYRVQYKQLATAQVELLESEAYQIRFDSQLPACLTEETKEPEPVPVENITESISLGITTEEADALRECTMIREEVKEEIKDVLAATRKLDLPLHSLKIKEDSKDGNGNFEFFENKEE